MSWMKSLYDTYELCSDIVGVQTQNEESALLPMGHTWMDAHITVILNSNGQFIGAEVLPEPERTMIPCTEAFEGHTGTNPVAHPLSDKLQYLAGDYATYVSADDRRFYEGYIDGLKRWCESPAAHPKVSTVYRYLDRGTLIADLVNARVFVLGSDGRLLDKWDGEEDTKPAVFRQKGHTLPSKMVVRFSVEDHGEHETRLWMDASVRDSFSRYIAATQQATGLCYITGTEGLLSPMHPTNLSSATPNAKLISANDKSNFTYRGRFSRPEQAVSISYEASQKAHQALRWLVANRGLKCGSQVIIAWAIARDQDVPMPLCDSLDAYGEETLTDSDRLIEAKGATGLAYARALNAALLGRSYGNLQEHQRVAVMAFDAATKGRLSITYYRELGSGEYLERVARWHQRCEWFQRLTKEQESTSGKEYFIGAPSSDRIIEAVLGKNAGAGKSESYTKLKKAARERLLYCVMDGERIPIDMVSAAVRRASNPLAQERKQVGNRCVSAKEQWRDWDEVLCVACTLVKKYCSDYRGEEYALALDKNRTDRDYLYGRLLAVADCLESYANWKKGENRPTNAIRYMNAFSQHPCRTWKVIFEQLNPYIQQLRRQADWYLLQIGDITSLFDPAGFESDACLNGTYLLGYFCQRQAIIAGRSKNDEDGGAENEPTE